MPKLRIALNKTPVIIPRSVYYFILFMMRIMISAFQKNKIFNSIICSVSIYMVDMFIGVKFSTHKLFHNIAVLWEEMLMSRYMNERISTPASRNDAPSVFYWCTSPSKNSPAFRRACLTFWVSCKKLFLTYYAGYVNIFYPTYKQLFQIPRTIFFLPFSIRLFHFYFSLRGECL